jgi:GT2 family glycosyltransferase
LKLSFPELQILRSTENQGFASGHFENYLIAKELKADLFWILNSDLEVNPDSLSVLVNAYLKMGDHLYGSVSLNPNSPELVDFGGAEWKESSNEKLTYNNWKNRSYSELIAKYTNPCEVESVEGSSMLIPMNVIEEHGFMQLDFFMYGEETDYCYRLRKKGVKSFVVPYSLVQHHNEGSTKLSPRLKAIPAYYRRRNALRFSIEHMGMTRWEAFGYKNGTIANLKTILIGRRKGSDELNYFYALGCLHAFLGIKGKVIRPENFI